MKSARSPLLSEFDTAEQEARYSAWLRAKVASAEADPRPAIPHDAAMVELDALIDQIEAERG